MSRNYKFHNPDGVYFVSFAVVEWIAVFKATRGDSCGSGGKRTISYIYRAEPEEIDSTEAYSLSRTGWDSFMPEINKAVQKMMRDDYPNVIIRITEF